MNIDNVSVTTGVVLGIASLFAWVTHVVVAIQSLIEGIESMAYAALLAIGAFMPPVGVIHGVGIWFGLW